MRTRIFPIAAAIVIGWIGVVGFFGCSSGPKKERTSLAEQMAQDANLSIVLSQKFEPTFALRNDPILATYLRRVALKLMSQTKAFEGVGVGVLLIDNRRAAWRNYSLPGVKVYFSANLLKYLGFENEAAAAIAFELGHLINRHVARKIFSDRIPEEVFQYSEEELSAALTSAVGILYRGGYDPRGLVSLWSVYQRFPQYAPLPIDTIDRLKEETYTRISELAPLRNPIIQTEEYTKLKPRLQGL